MQDTLVTHKMKAQIARFSGVLSERLPKVARRFVHEMLYGIQSRQTVRLSQISRALNEPIAVKKTEERLCRQLQRTGLGVYVRQQILSQAASRIKEDTLLVLDLSDIAKKYARKMEYLAGVRDGSEDKNANGYWLAQVIGVEQDRLDLTPLYSHLYSQDAPGFKSENDEILTAIDTVRAHTGGRGTWVIDRGGDRGVLFDGLLTRRQKFIVRLVGSRHLLVDGVPVECEQLAATVPVLHTERIVREEDSREKIYTVQLGYQPVKLPKHAEQLYLVVVHGFGEKPLLLLTNRKVTGDRRMLCGIMYAYIRRWKVEDTLRFMKQSYNLEDIRILTYHRLQTMIVLVLAAMYFVCVWLGHSLKLQVLTMHALSAAKRFFGIPDFRFYAIADGIKEIMAGFRGRIVPEVAATDPPAQLTLFIN